MVFDLETTGTNISQDRIVEIALIKVFPDGATERKSRRVNPTIPIPLESSMIHGIYDADVASEPTFKQLAKSLATWMEGCDLAGFNILHFDLPMLVEEFLRADIEFDIDQRKIVDAQKIYHLMEKRNLTAAYKFYCDKELTNAHSADADTEATYEVLLSQIKRYEGQDAVDPLGNKLGRIENDMASINRLSVNRVVDLAGRMVYKGNQVIFNFGKHKGKEVSQVLRDEPSFYDWMMKGDFSLDTKRKLTQIKLSDFGK